MPIPKPVKGSTKTARNAIACLVKVVTKPQVDRETGEVVVDELGNPVMARASRALETDCVNCTRASEDPGHLAVWQQTDWTRELCHNNEAANDGRPGTYSRHDLPPGPRDHVTLAWADKHVISDSEEAAGAHERFVVRHDGNGGDREESPTGTMRAHAVASNADVCAGRRLSPRLTNESDRRPWKDPQCMTAERGLHAFQRVDGSLTSSRLDARARPRRRRSSSARPSSRAARMALAWAMPPSRAQPRRRPRAPPRG